MSLTQQPLLSGRSAGFSKTVPIINTDATGPVEWAAYGTDPTTPLLRSGCVDSAGQRALSWGDPVISERATVRPPPAGIPLSILPGQTAAIPVYAPGATTAPAPATATATETPSATSAAAAPTAQAPPAFTGTPDTSASSQRTTDTGGGTPWGTIIFGILTVLFAAGSRATSWRVRKDFEVDKIPARAYLYGGVAALTGLIAASSAPSSVGGFAGAAVLAVIVALVLSAQRAAVAGHRVSLVALIKTARSDWPGAGVGASVGFLVGYFAGSGVATPGTLYGVLAGAGIGIGAAHLRQTHARVAGWMVDAALVADILGIPEKTITETGEVVFSTTSEGGFVVTTLSQAARAHLDGIEDRCAQVAGHLMITMATRMGVEAGPVDDATAAHRAAMTGSGGLVGGAHSGADPWTGEAPAGTPANSGVDMHKPGTTAAPDAVDFSAGWD